jgi:hypothetical protein
MKSTHMLCSTKSSSGNRHQRTPLYEKTTSWILCVTVEDPGFRITNKNSLEKGVVCKALCLGITNVCAPYRDMQKLLEGKARFFSCITHNLVPRSCPKMVFQHFLGCAFILWINLWTCSLNGAFFFVVTCLCDVQRFVWLLIQEITFLLWSGQKNKQPTLVRVRNWPIKGCTYMPKHGCLRNNSNLILCIRVIYFPQGHETVELKGMWQLSKFFITHFIHLSVPS